MRVKDGRVVFESARSLVSDCDPLSVRVGELMVNDAVRENVSDVVLVTVGPPVAVSDWDVDFSSITVAERSSVPDHVLESADVADSVNSSGAVVDGNTERLWALRLIVTLSWRLVVSDTRLEKVMVGEGLDVCDDQPSVALSECDVVTVFSRDMVPEPGTVVVS